GLSTGGPQNNFAQRNDGPGLFGQRDEVTWWQQTQTRVVPTKQSLNSREPSRLDMHLWLVMEFKFVMVYSRAQFTVALVRGCTRAIACNSFLMFKGAAGNGGHLRELKGLRNVIECSGPHRLDCELNGSLTADHNDDSVGCLTRYEPNHFQSIHA